MLFDVYDVDLFEQLPVSVIENVNDSVYVGTRDGFVVLVSIFRQERPGGEIKAIGRLESRLEINPKCSPIEQLDAVPCFKELIALSAGNLAICSMHPLEIVATFQALNGPSQFSRFAPRGEGSSPYLCVAAGDTVIIYERVVLQSGRSEYTHRYTIKAAAPVSDLLWSQIDDAVGGFICVATKETCTVQTKHGFCMHSPHFAHKVCSISQGGRDPNFLSKKFERSW
jgi:hypothetical protein